jgi:hypothetical protein
LGNTASIASRRGERRRKEGLEHMNHQKLKEYGGRVLSDGTLELRDPNDNARHRYQYRIVDSRPCRRVLPETGDYDPPPQWEPIDLPAIAATHQGCNPILDYFFDATA